MLRSIEQITSVVQDRLTRVVRANEPGAVVLVSSGGEGGAVAAAGLASIATSAPITARTAFDTGSVAKMVTGLAVAILEEEGALSASAPVRDVLPEWPAYADSVRIEHLIHQESGLRSYFTLLYYLAGWHPRRPPTSEEAFRVLARAGSLTFAPGSQYQYCDSNYLVLARIVERSAGEPLGAFARRRIFEPLGMEGAGLADVARMPGGVDGYQRYPLALASAYAQRAPGVERGWHPVGLAYNHAGAEGLFASADDLRRLAAHILRPKVVSSRTMQDRMLRPPRVREDGFGYGHGLNVGTYRGRRFIGHDGRIWGYTASVCVLPDDGVEMVCLTNRSDLGAWALRTWVLDLLDKGSAHAAQTAEQPARRVLGRYLDPTTARLLEIEESGGQQTASLWGGSPIPLALDDDGTLRGDGVTMAAGFTCGDRPALIVREESRGTSTFQPFAEGRAGGFGAYEGLYRCAALDTAFDVKATETGIRLTNPDRRRPSMDLDYAPTIPDFFWTHDPYPELSQIQFLRADERVMAFIYRDPDGDRREDFRFVRSRRRAWTSSFPSRGAC